MSADPVIRYATEQDVGSILYMIKELASFENEADAVEATEEHLLRTLSFPKSPTATELKDFTPGFSRTLLIIVPDVTPDDNGPTASVTLPIAGVTTMQEQRGAVAGMALFFNNYSTWRGAPGIYLEDLYVRPQFRRSGYARLLLQALGQETLRLGGKRLEWSCLKWNENALKFYGSLGAKRMDEWVGLRVEGEALEKLGAAADKSA